MVPDPSLHARRGAGGGQPAISGAGVFFAVWRFSISRTIGVDGLAGHCPHRDRRHYRNRLAAQKRQTCAGYALFSPNDIAR